MELTEKEIRRVIESQLVGFVKPEKLQIVTDNIIHVLKSEGMTCEAEPIEPEFDDGVKCCPECESPNQFGELCPACREERDRCDPFIGAAD